MIFHCMQGQIEVSWYFIKEKGHMSFFSDRNQREWGNRAGTYYQVVPSPRVQYVMSLKYNIWTYQGNGKGEKLDKFRI